MVGFDLWKEAFIFGCIYSFVVVIPACIATAIVGKKLIDQLGTYPSQAAMILNGASWKLVVIEVVVFALLIGFYFIFSSS